MRGKVTGGRDLFKQLSQARKIGQHTAPFPVILCSYVFIDRYLRSFAPQAFYFFLKRFVVFNFLF